MTYLAITTLVWSMITNRALAASPISAQRAARAITEGNAAIMPLQPGISDSGKHEAAMPIMGLMPALEENPQQPTVSIQLGGLKPETVSPNADAKDSEDAPAGIQDASLTMQRRPESAIMQAEQALRALQKQYGTVAPTIDYLDSGPSKAKGRKPSLFTHAIAYDRHGRRLMLKSGKSGKFFIEIADSGRKIRDIKIGLKSALFVAADPASNLIYVFSGDAEVEIYDSQSGKRVMENPFFKSGTEPVRNLVGATIDGKERLVLFSNPPGDLPRLRIFSKNSYGTPDYADTVVLKNLAGLRFPYHLAKDASGNFWIGDKYSENMAIVDPSGELIKALPRPRPGAGAFAIDLFGTLRQLSDGSGHWLESYTIAIPGAARMSPEKLTQGLGRFSGTKKAWEGTISLSNAALYDAKSRSNLLATVHVESDNGGFAIVDIIGKNNEIIRRIEIKKSLLRRPLDWFIGANFPEVANREERSLGNPSVILKGAAPESIAIHPITDQLYILHRDGRLTVYDRDTGRQVREIPAKVLGTNKIAAKARDSEIAFNDKGGLIIFDRPGYPHRVQYEPTLKLFDADIAHYRKIPLQMPPSWDPEGSSLAGPAVDAQGNYWMAYFPKDYSTTKESALFIFDQRGEFLGAEKGQSSWDGHLRFSAGKFLVSAGVKSDGPKLAFFQPVDDIYSQMTVSLVATLTAVFAAASTAVDPSVLAPLARSEAEALARKLAAKARERVETALNGPIVPRWEDFQAVFQKSSGSNVRYQLALEKGLSRVLADPANRSFFYDLAMQVIRGLGKHDYGIPFEETVMAIKRLGRNKRHGLSSEQQAKMEIAIDNANADLHFRKALLEVEGGDERSLRLYEDYELAQGRRSVAAQ